MRRIAHISDLHFGKHEPEVVQALADSLCSAHLSLLAVSGDITQRARPREFEAAREFLDAVPVPRLVVPGNHDVPLYNPFKRFNQPLRRFRRFIGPPEGQSYIDDRVVVLGINTARSSTFKNGRISHDQIFALDRRLHLAASHLFKVLVAHHPFIPPAHLPSPALVGRGGLALRELEGHGIHVLLAGHLHRRFTRDARAHYPTLERSILVMQAGTAASTRLRGEDNSYNIVEIELPRVRCVHMRYDGKCFVAESMEQFERREHEWHLLN